MVSTPTSTEFESFGGSTTNESSLNPFEFETLGWEKEEKLFPFFFFLEYIDCIVVVEKGIESGCWCYQF